MCSALASYGGRPWWYFPRILKEPMTKVCVCARSWECFFFFLSPSHLRWLLPEFVNCETVREGKDTHARLPGMFASWASTFRKEPSQLYVIRFEVCGRCHTHPLPLFHLFLTYGCVCESTRE